MTPGSGPLTQGGQILFLIVMNRLNDRTIIFDRYRKLFLKKRIKE